MLDGCEALGLERLDSLCDLVTELNAADALITALNAGRLPLDFDCEPDAADAGGLHGEAAGFARNASVSRVAADHRVERAMTADLLVDHDIDHDIALDLDAGGLEQLDCEDVASHSTLHIARATAIEAALLDLGRPRIVAPA